MDRLDRIEAQDIDSTGQSISLLDSCRSFEILNLRQVDSIAVVAPNINSAMTSISTSEMESKTLSESEGSTSSPKNEPHINLSIEITIDSIENFSSIELMSQGSVQMLIRLEHNGITLGESPPIILDNDDEAPTTIYVDYNSIFTIVMDNEISIGAAVSTPILITAMGISNVNDDRVIRSFETSGDVGGKNKGKRTSTLKLKNATEHQGPIILGICNFDIMPLLLGEISMREELLLKIQSDNARASTMPWMILPRIIVSARILDSDAYFPGTKINFMTITVESIYNLPSSLTDDMGYKASTVIYHADKIPEDVIFHGGVRTSVPDFEKIKCWQLLADLEGYAKFTKYKLNESVTKNVLKDEIDLKSSESEPRVQWNSMQRFWVSQSDSEVILKMIQRHNCWPFFFTASSKSKDVSKQKGNESQDTFLLFQCYADVSELLYPGTTRTRTVAQLHTFSISAMAERTGLEKCTFEKDIRKEPAKEKEKKGKSSTKGSSVPMQTAPASTESEYTSSLPLLTDNGRPVFVIIEFEVHHPLQPARSLVDLTNSIDKMLHSYTLPPNPYTSVLAEEHYSNCIKKLVDTLCGAYQEFLADLTIPDNFEQRPQNVSSPTKMFGWNKKNPDSMERPLCDKVIMESINNQGDCKYTYIKDEIACFVQYLHETGLYVSVRSALKNKIIMLLDQKFKIEMPTLSKNECQNFVATAYIYLVEQMHCTLNKFVEGRYATDAANSSATSYLSFAAEESFALGCIIDARKTYSSIIDNDRKNPDTWLEYAIFLLRIGDLERAMECCREAIILDRQHKIGLLLYGVLLSHNENYPDAEIFLQIVTQLHPQFAEGWAILHLFYLRTEFLAGADVTIQVAQKCLQDDAPDTITTAFLKRDPLPWTTLNIPKDRIYLVTLTLLLKLSCLDFAGIALAQELSEVGRTRHFLYLMAVQHYMQSRYADAICHLKEAVDLDGMDYSLASLLGHCHEEEGNFDEAIYCYEFANTLFNRPEDLHLAQLRLGYLYLTTERYEFAKKIFLIVCKNSPTCRTWLGVGIACFHLNDMQNAEKALTEANYLNMHNAEVWGYLCLVNMSLSRYDEFLQCYQQVVKNNLTNIRVWIMIKDLMETLGYSTPVMSIDSQDSLIHKSPENVG